MTATRAGGSGQVLRPESSQGTPSWNALAPLVLTLEAAAHEPGLYQIALSSYLTAFAAAGTFSMTLGWDQPRFGATTIAFAGISLTGTEIYVNILRDIWSSGSSPISVTVASAGLTGSPNVQLACAALRVGLDLEA